MSCHDHPHGARPPGLGIPRQGEFDPAAFEQAVSDLLRACGIAPDTTHTGRTAQRVRELWQRRLLGGAEEGGGQGGAFRGIHGKKDSTSAE